MYAPGVLWTAAHHRIPLLSVMHNNRAYHQELMHVQRMCNGTAAGSPTSRAPARANWSISRSTTPPVAQGVGVSRRGPITNPNDLGPAISARCRSRQARRAGTHRRRHPTALKQLDNMVMPMTRLPLTVAIGAVMTIALAAHAGNARQAPSAPPPPSQPTAAHAGRRFGERQGAVRQNGCYQCHNYQELGGGFCLTPNPLPVPRIRQLRAFASWRYAATKVMSGRTADVHAVSEATARPKARRSIIPLLAR